MIPIMGNITVLLMTVGLFIATVNLKKR